MKTTVSSQIGCMIIMAMFVLLGVNNLSKTPPANSNGMPVYGITVFSIIFFSMFIGFCISNIIHILAEKRRQKDVTMN